MASTEQAQTGKIHVDLVIDKRRVHVTDTAKKIEATAKALFEAIVLLGGDVVMAVSIGYVGDRNIINIDVAPARVDWVDRDGRNMYAVVVYDRNDFYRTYMAKAVVWISDTMDNVEFTTLLSGIITQLSYHEYPEITYMVNSLVELFDRTLHVDELRGVEFNGVDEGGDYVVTKFTLNYFESTVRLEDENEGKE